MPCCEVFDAQPQDYRDSVLPAAAGVRLSIEAGVTDYWYKYVGTGGVRLGVDRFGESAPYQRVYEHFGLTPEHVAQAAREALSRTVA
jgi:transketolase